MTNLKLLSAALIAAAIATPAMARESHVTLQHRANATAGDAMLAGVSAKPGSGVAPFATQPWDTRSALANPRVN